jgi:hypothetical protein
MSPRRPRRRARRRSSARPVLYLVAAAVVVALLIGGLTRVSSQSQGYDAMSNRALAAQGAVVVDQSNDTSAMVRSLVADLQGQSRQVLQAGLDGAAQQTAVESSRAALAAGSSPNGTLGPAFATVFAERAQSMSELRGAIDGFLGIRPVPPAGTSAADSYVPTASVNSLSASQATNRISAAGALLARSDRLYRSVRASLGAAAGHARLPASVWVADPQQWELGTVAAEVDLMATSSTLVASHYVVLRTVRLEPPALPTPQGVAAGVSVISPVSQLGVTAVLSNLGSVDEPRVSVRFTVADQASGATLSHTETTGAALGASVTLPTVAFDVKPGTTYVLTVGVILPPGQTLSAGTLVQQTLQIAPGT